MAERLGLNMEEKEGDAHDPPLKPQLTELGLSTQGSEIHECEQIELNTLSDKKEQLNDKKE